MPSLRKVGPRIQFSLPKGEQGIVQSTLILAFFCQLGLRP